MPTSTTRLALHQPAGTDGPVELRTAINNHAATLDTAVLFLQGTSGARGAAGTQGRFYYETDTGLLKWDTGSAWVVAPPAAASILTAMLADASVTGAKLASDAKVKIYTPLMNTPGPLTVSGTFTPSGGRPCWCFFQGCGYIPSGAGNAGYLFQLDGVTAANMQMPFQTPGQRQTLPFGAVSLGNLSNAVHTVGFTAAGMASDGNDKFTAIVLEINQ